MRNCTLVPFPRNIQVAVAAAELLDIRFAVVAWTDDILVEILIVRGEPARARHVAVPPLVDEKGFDELECSIPIPVEEVKWVNMGARVMLTSEDGTQEWNGTVVRKSDYVDPNSQAVSVFISVQNDPENPLYEGQYMRAMFEGEVKGNAMEIPRRAVFNSNMVFVVKDSLLEKAEIHILKINQESMIFNGLTEGDYVVIEPLINVVEGTRVEVY